jgi:putative alpha-1,2-mannosidase
MNRLYSATPDGYCGDEDNGQTSAWYVFSAMGFYPVCPGTDEYVLGAPLFKKVTLSLENGNKVEINAPNNSDSNRYIRKMKYNGETYNKNFFKYSDLLKGAKIDYNMSATPNKKRATDKESVPYSLTNEE